MKLNIQFDSNNFDHQYYNCARVTLTEENGEKQTKTVSIHSLLEALTHSKVSEKVFSRIGAVPNGFYDGVIQNDKNTGLSADIITVLPKGKQHMVFEDTPYYVCNPSLVFYFGIEKNRLVSSKVYSIKDIKPSNKSRLYIYPFGNVRRFGGEVCWGSNSFSNVRTIKQLEAITSLFIQSPCNMDHYETDSTKLKMQSLRELLEYLKDLDEFPDEILKARSKKGGTTTIGDLINDFAG